MTLRVLHLMALLLVVLIGTRSERALGWGNEVHRITGLMAQEMLTPRARIAVNQLLDGGDLSDASMHMDIYRAALKGEVPGSERWHFDNRPICGEPTALGTYCPAGNCASAQLPRLFDVLSASTRSKAERLQALRFLVHIVADVHQPLHTADDNDAGGSAKMMLMPGALMPRNLHLVWDVDLPKIATRGLSEQQVAKDLIANHKGKFADWMRGDTALWMAQSYGIAKRLAYGKLPGFSCGELDGKTTGLRDGKPWTNEPLALPRDYVEGATGIIPILMAQAGARIGGMLNAALDPQGATKAPSAVAAPKPDVPATISFKDALSRPPSAQTPLK